MEQLTEKELMALNELLGEEELLIKKFEMLSNQSQDQGVKSKFMDISKKHKEHFTSLYEQLK